MNDVLRRTNSQQYQQPEPDIHCLYITRSIFETFEFLHCHNSNANDNWHGGRLDSGAGAQADHSESGG